jgi:lysophospholipase L1-like esterase
MSRPLYILARPFLTVTLAIVVLLFGNHFLMEKSPTPQAHALASPATTIRQHRILCYGDSLTAGTTSDYSLHPYAPFLEQVLKATDNNNDVHVRHFGLPGWTAQRMVASKSDEQGIQYQIRRVKDPSLSLVIILAGTNDLGYGFSQDEIYQNVVQLHQIAMDCNGVPATLAIAIPPSGYTSQDAHVRAVVEGVNKALQNYSETEPRMYFVPFPFEYQAGGENWSSDTLHFSPIGYQRLGESLVPVVEKILDQLPAE